MTKARALVALAVLALTTLLAHEMWRVLAVGGMTGLEWLMLVLFVVNISWICLGFVSAVLGLALGLRSSRPVAQIAAEPLRERTALLLPTYNEDPSRVFAAAEAMLESVDETGEGQHFDLMILSDTSDPAIWLAEVEAANRFRRESSRGNRLFYRHRLRNVGRKAGNVADFCRRWGGAYAYLVVLDADSLMEGRSLVELVRRMDADPMAGIIQTVPRLINGQSLLGRVQAFATWAYGPVLAIGLAFWHGASSTYWGHNAIIRMSAFAGQAGLPVLGGAPPLGGHILSHDFVEAALVRRGGYKVRLAPDLGGSFEEGPPDLPALAARDRRWCQGNMQHARILGAAGLHPMSRFHLAHGIMAYLAAPFWLALLLTGLLLAVQAYLVPPGYFPDGVMSLFPLWPTLDAVRAARLLALCLAVLLAPKLMGLIGVLASGAAAAAGGRIRVTLGVLTEVLATAAIAPITMLNQTRAVVEVLAGRDSGWLTQRRADGGLTLRAVLRFYRWHMGLGLGLGAASWLVSTDLLLWMLPAILGLILAVPVALAIGSVRLGRIAARLGILATPEEHEAPAVVVRAKLRRRHWMALRTAGWPLERLTDDAELMRMHVEALDPATLRRPGEMNETLATARLRIDDAVSAGDVRSVLTGLSDEEQRSVMSCPETLLALAGHCAAARHATTPLLLVGERH